MSSFIDQIHDRIRREGIYFDYAFNANANFLYEFDPRELEYEVLVYIKLHHLRDSYDAKSLYP